MKKHHEFSSANRYIYDFDLCSSGNGFAQIDTSSDASNFGNWANPFTFVIFSFIKGWCYTTECETVEEFTAEMKDITDFYGEGFKGLDAGFNEGLKQEFITVGLEDLLH